jgi:2,3-bisphosphoglycerate-independent phosphoglycerate mutase
MTAVSSARRRVLLFFIDGIGVGSDDPAVNPLASDAWPVLRLTKGAAPRSSVAGSPAFAGGLDASLGVPGLPQSATGQTAILTGVNAPAALGRHVSGFPGPALQEILRSHSLFKTLTGAGRSAVFLNAFGPRFFENVDASDPTRPRRRLSATTLATLAGGGPIRDWNDLTGGRAVAHDLTHWRMRDYGFDLAPRTAEEAGAIIAREAMRSDFSLFEYFETDKAGHAQDAAAAARCLTDLNAALEAVLDGVDLRDTLVLVASDHGNLEDARVKTHTLNPALFTAWGALDGLPVPESLVGIAPLVLRATSAA